MSLAGTIIFSSQILLKLPPPFPLKPIVLQPIFFAAFNPLITLRLVPPVLMPIAKSVLFAKASIYGNTTQFYC